MKPNIFSFIRPGANLIIDEIRVEHWKMQLKPVEDASVRCSVSIDELNRVARVLGDHEWAISRVGNAISAYLREKTGTVDDITTHFEKRHHPLRFDVICVVGMPPSGLSTIGADVQEHI